MHITGTKQILALDSVVVLTQNSLAHMETSLLICSVSSQRNNQIKLTQNDYETKKRAHDSQIVRG